MKYTIRLTLKLKCLHHSIKIDFDDERLLTNLFNDITSDKQFIRFGQIAFAKDQFIVATYQYKKVKNEKK